MMGRVRKTLAFALALFGLFDSLYLLWVYVSPAHPIVCLGTGCDVVRASDYAHLFGIPTPAFGVALYAILAALMFAETKVADGTLVRRLILGISAVGVLASAALTYIEAAVLHAWCAWCVAQAVVITLIFLLAITGLRAGYDGAALRKAAASRLWTVLMVAIIVGSIAFYLLARAEQKMMEAPAPPAEETIAARLVRPESHVTGNMMSTVTFVEFGDLQCPACAASYPIVRNLRQQYGNRVKFVFRHYPFPTIHPFAMHSAEASECAAQQGKFWEYVDRVYEAKGDLADTSLERYAAELGLDKDRFHQCLSTDATLPQVQRDQLDGVALGVRSTPTFFVGKRRIEGALTEYQFSTMLLDDLQAAGALKSEVPAPSLPPAAADPPKSTPAAEKQAPAKTAGLSMPGGGSGGGFFNVKGASTDCSEDAPKGPEPPLIHTADAQKRLGQGAVFVDVRSASDFHQGHIKGALNLPLLEVETRAGELPKEKSIVVYEGGTAAAGDVCAAAKSAARVLISRGLQAVVYQDGLKDWEKAGAPVEK